MQFLIAAVVLLRVAVPAGFMPSNVQQGWFLKWCPDGMPVQTMMALLGHSHDHHGDAQQAEFEACDLSGFTADSAVAAFESDEVRALSSSPLLVRGSPRLLLSSDTVFQPRAPPSKIS